MRKNLRLILIILILFVSACSSQPPESSIQTAIAQTQLSVSDKSNNPTNTVTPTFTLTFTPTRQPTDTPTPTLSPTFTAKVSRTNSPTASYKPTKTTDFYDQMVVSPDGKYVAKMYSEFFYPTGVQTIEVLDDNGGVLWKIPYQGEMPAGDPHPSLWIYQWSNDSSHVYFYYVFGYDGIPTLWNGFDLQSLDIASGEIKRVLPGEGLMAFAISPEEDTIAYTRMQDEPRRLIIRDLANGQERSSAIELQSKGFTQAGDISWSPQGDKIFLFTLLVDEELMQGILLDLSTMKLKTLFEFDLWEEEYYFNGWTESGIEFLIYPGDEVIRFNVNTGEASTLGTATPVP